MIDVIPKRVLAPRCRVPPTLQSFPVLREQPFVLLQLEGEVEGKEGFFLVRIVDFMHYVANDFLFAVAFAAIQVSEERRYMIVFVEGAPHPPSPNRCNQVQVGVSGVLNQKSVLFLPFWVASNVSANLKAQQKLKGF